jgi:hypothetical protein
MTDGVVPRIALEGGAFGCELLQRHVHSVY